MEAVSLLQEDKVFAAVAGESRGAGHDSSAGLSDIEGEKCSTRILSAEEELKRFPLENKPLITKLKEYNVRVRNLKKSVEEEELKGIAVL